MIWVYKVEKHWCPHSDYILVLALVRSGIKRFFFSIDNTIGNLRYMDRQVLHV